MSLTKFRSNISKLLLSLVLIVTILSGNITNNIVLANFAAPSDPPDEQAILDIFQSYDPDVYHILSTELDGGRSFMIWYDLSNSETIIDMLDTAVHETYHSYTNHSTAYYQEIIYTGNGTEYLVDMRDARSLMFPSSEMAKTIPYDLETFRYETYIGEGSSASANQQGVFGLLNEFSAYYWGLHSLYYLMPYFESYSSDYNIWAEYANSLANNMNAYAEFKFWILSYMDYAKKYRPDTYQMIINNMNFCKAFTEMDRNFAELISDNLDGLSGLNAMLKSDGYMIENNGQSIVCYRNHGYSYVELHAYNTLTQEMESDSDLIQVEKDIKATSEGNVITSPVYVEGTLDRIKKISIGHFCERLYTAALNRSFDIAGKEYWTNLIFSGMSGADAAKQFFFSPEFKDSKVSNTEFVTRLYRTFMGREPDKDGLDYWVNKMKGGMSRESVFDGFVNSPEWANVCQAYGIVSGGVAKPSLTAKPSDAINDFATRLYSTCLGRMPEDEGLKYWAKELANHTKTGTMAAYEFFFSDEFTNAHYYNKEFVARLYRTFMDREPDEDGYNYWLNQLSKGTARSEVFIGFAESPEFMTLCKDANILN